MNLWSKIFKKSDDNRSKSFKSIYSAPVFSDFGSDIYVSDIVNNAIERRASEISKLEIRSVVERDENTRQVIKDDITRLFRERPNKWQTTSDFLSSVEWIRLKKGNVFIYPQYQMVKTKQGPVKRFTGFYPLNPTQIEIGTNADYIEIKFWFADGYNIVLPYSELIHLKWRRGTHYLLGGDDNGILQTKDTEHALNALHKTLEGLPKSIEASLQIKGMYIPKTVLDNDKLKSVRDHFEEHIISSKTGIIATDLAGEFKPMSINPAEVKSETMNFIKGVVCEKYGVSLEILSGNANDEQHEAFYQSAIEDFIVMFEQAFSAVCFSDREKDVGHKVRAYYARLKKLSITKVNEIATLATNVGLMTLDTILDMYGLPPLPNGEGKVRIQSLNFVNTDIAKQYQLGNNAIGGNQVE